MTHAGIGRCREGLAVVPDLGRQARRGCGTGVRRRRAGAGAGRRLAGLCGCEPEERTRRGRRAMGAGRGEDGRRLLRSEEHTSELQSLMRISYAVFCLKKKKIRQNNQVSTLTPYTRYLT